MRNAKKIEGNHNFGILSKKIDRLIDLVAIAITYGRDLKGQTKVLSTGFKPTEITRLLHTTANSVRVALTLYENRQGDEN